MPAIIKSNASHNKPIWKSRFCHNEMSRSEIRCLYVCMLSHVCFAYCSVEKRKKNYWKPPHVFKFASVNEIKWLIPWVEEAKIFCLPDKSCEPFKSVTNAIHSFIHSAFLVFCDFLLVLAFSLLLLLFHFIKQWEWTSSIYFICNVAMEWVIWRFYANIWKVKELNQLNLCSNSIAIVMHTGA